MDQLKQLVTEFGHYLPYLVGGIVVLAVGWLAAWPCGRWVWPTRSSPWLSA